MPQQPTPQNDLTIPMSVANETELAGIVCAGSPAGSEVFVVTPPSGPGQYYTYLPADVNAAQAGLVVAAKGGGNWVKQSAGITQTGYAEIAANTSVATAAGITDLLSITLTTIGGDLLIQSTFSAENSAAPGATQFELWLDGAILGPGAANGATMLNTTGNTAQSGAKTKRVTGLAAGSHTVKLRWKTPTAASTSTINVTANDEHASLSVFELNR